MKIAFVVYTFPCLSETFILSQITGLIDRGHEVHIYANKADITSKVHPNVEKYHLLDQVYYLPHLPNGRLPRLIKGLVLLLDKYYRSPQIMLRLLSNGQFYGPQLLAMKWIYSTISSLYANSYDIIHCHFAPKGQEGMIFQDIIQDTSHSCPKLLVSLHGFDVNRIRSEQSINVYKQLFQRGNLYTVNSNFTKNKAIALGFPETKIVKLPVGLDLSKYRFQKKRLLPGELVKLITVARLVEKKGLEYSIKAVAEVAKYHPHLEYQIVGDGELRHSLQKLVLELGLSDKIKLLGWMTEDKVRKLYEQAHIFILSSVTASNGDMEGQGLVLQEAQAMGLPVLSSLHNGIPDGVRDGKSAFLLPERDIDGLTKKLKHLIEHPEIWAEMGKAGRAHVEKFYDIDKLNDRLVEIYKQLMNEQNQQAVSK